MNYKTVEFKFKTPIAPEILEVVLRDLAHVIARDFDNPRSKAGEISNEADGWLVRYRLGV